MSIFAETKLSFMSAWGIANFENDVALNFVQELTQYKTAFSVSEFVDAFAGTFDADQTTLDDCFLFLAVAELLAALQGSPSDDLPEEMKDWIENKYIQIEQSLSTKTADIVTMIIKDSEAKEMYDGSPYYKVWMECQKDLIKRLRA